MASTSLTLKHSLKLSTGSCSKITKRCLATPATSTTTTARPIWGPKKVSEPLPFGWKPKFDIKAAGFEKRELVCTPWRGVPDRRGPFQSPTDFLSALKRGCEKKLKEPGTWEEFWIMDSERLKAKGVTGIPDRKYILRHMNLYRRGYDPRVVAKATRAPKKLSGAGDAVQGNLRTSRSKRLVETGHLFKLRPQQWRLYTGPTKLQRRQDPWWKGTYGKSMTAEPRVSMRRKQKKVTTKELRKAQNKSRYDLVRRRRN